MWKPKFIDRAMNRGFKEKNTERSTTLSCSAGNLALRRLYHRGWRPTMETDSGSREEESALLKGEVRLRHEEYGSELRLNEDKIAELNNDQLPRHGGTVVQLYGGKSVEVFGKVGVTIEATQGEARLCAQEVCRICITNKRRRCGKPRAPYQPMSDDTAA